MNMIRTRDIGRHLILWFAVLGLTACSNPALPVESLQQKGSVKLTDQVISGFSSYAMRYAGSYYAKDSEMTKEMLDSEGFELRMHRTPYTAHVETTTGKGIRSVIIMNQDKGYVQADNGWIQLSELEREQLIQRSWPSQARYGSSLNKQVMWGDSTYQNLLEIIKRCISVQTPGTPKILQDQETLMYTVTDKCQLPMLQQVVNTVQLMDTSVDVKGSYWVGSSGLAKDVLLAMDIDITGKFILPEDVRGNNANIKAKQMVMRMEFNLSSLNMVPEINMPDAVTNDEQQSGRIKVPGVNTE
jgi:hypothetical protein